nr:rhomboid family intramembrane serine protease [Longimicrobium terrae]
MGEWWRLLTAPVLHGGVVHWAFNVSALDSLGRMMERRAPRAWLPITFLLAALAGGAASALLPPDGVSVGSSGGLMGLFGFLVVMVRRRRADFPEGFSRALLLNIALIGVVGGIAYAYIDNAAHAGGLAVGLLIGLLAVPSAARTPEWTGGAWLEWAGRLALGVILASAAAAIFVTIRIFLR